MEFDAPGGFDALDGGDVSPGLVLDPRNRSPIFSLQATHVDAIRVHSNPLRCERADLFKHVVFKHHVLTAPYLDLCALVDPICAARTDGLALVGTDEAIVADRRAADAAQQQVQAARVFKSIALYCQSGKRPSRAEGLPSVPMIGETPAFPLLE